ncbi:hypothetical protein Tco_0554543 [Tanacetum coccineum]
MNRISSRRLSTITCVLWQYSQNISCVSKGKGLFGPNGGRGGKVEVGFDDFGGGGEEIRNCGGNDGRGSSIFRRGGGLLAICSMESKDGLGGGGLVFVGEECLDGCVEASRGEVKGGGVEFGVTKSLLEKEGGEEGKEKEKEGEKKKGREGKGEGKERREGKGEKKKKEKEEEREKKRGKEKGKEKEKTERRKREKKDCLVLWRKEVGGEECLDGCVEASRGEVKGGGVEFGVTKSLLGEIPRESTGESGNEEFRVDRWAV